MGYEKTAVFPVKLSRLWMMTQSLIEQSVGLYSSPSMVSVVFPLNSYGRSSTRTRRSLVPA